LPGISDLLWIISSFVLTALSHIFFSHGPDFSGGAFYITFVMAYSLVVFVLHKKNLLKNSGPKGFYFFLGCLIIFAGSPLFENDHFRYLWEGKVFISGFNPYLHAPDSVELAHIPFIGKEFIGFKTLTSIYPPLALIWFGLGAELLLLMGLNALLVFFLFKRLRVWQVSPFHLALAFPYLQKEFIGAIHIDLLAFMLVFLSISATKNMTGFKSLLLIGLSYWVKLLGIIALPLLLLKKENRNKRFYAVAALIVLSLPLGLYFLIGDFKSMTGPSAFGANWVWMPGFYTILTRVLGVVSTTARTLSLVGFLLYFLMLVFYWGFKNKNQTDFPLHFLYLFFLGFMFFSPVYNAWYAIWFLGLALLGKRTYGVLYAVFSCWCYLAYGNKSLIPLGEFMAHLFFPLALWEMSFLSFSVSKKNP